jgi:hypothetical protein
VHGALLRHAELKQGVEENRLLYQARYGRHDIASYEGQKAFLFLEGAQENQADPVEAGEVASLLIHHQIPVVILNACQSGKQVGATETSLGSRLLQAGGRMATKTPKGRYYAPDLTTKFTLNITNPPLRSITIC